MRCIASLRKENSSSDRRLERGGRVKSLLFLMVCNEMGKLKKTASGLLGNGMGVMGGGGRGVGIFRAKHPFFVEINSFFFDSHIHLFFFFVFPMLKKQTGKRALTSMAQHKYSHPHLHFYKDPSER